MSKYTIGGVTTTIQPKLGYRFKVVFVGMGSASATSAITGYVSSFTPATFQQDSVPIDAYVSRYYVIGKHTIGTLSIELRNDASNTVASLVQQQIDRQYNAETQSHAASAGAVKFTTKLMYLDGTNNMTSTPKVLEGFVYTGCWIQDANFGQLSYSSSDPVMISLTIQPDNFYHIVSGITDDGSINSGNSTATAITAPTLGTSAT